jgi:hypothetical protein
MIVPASSTTYTYSGPRFDVPNPVDEIDGCDVADGGQDGEELQEALGVIA